MLRLKQFAAVVGPGLVAMLANTDAGSVITASQSGAQWGYRLLLLQFLIIPLLFIVQELAVRLALCTGKGFGELMVQRLGRALTLLSMTAFAISCFGALVTQMVGLSGVGLMFGVPVWQTVGLLVVLIFAMISTGSYRSVERIAIFLGSFEIVFLVVAWKAHPDYQQIANQLQQMPLNDSGFLYLLAANLGTSIMPWTVFYQQSAIIDKGLGIKQIKMARLDTLFGAILCQAVTAAVLVAAAAAFGAKGAGISLESVPQISQAFTSVLGEHTGRILFAIALSGGALVATIVVCLSACWALGEVTGVRHSLEHHPFEAPWFYAAFGVMLLAAGALVSSGLNLVRLAIATGVVNALLLPVVLGLLYFMAHRELTGAYRLKVHYSRFVAMLLFFTATLGVYAGIVGALG